MYPVFATFKFLNREMIIGSYGLAIIISFLFSSALIVFLAQKKKYDIFNIINYLLIIFSGGFLSALIVGFIYTGSLIRIRDMYSLPLVSWGGFLGGAVVVILFKYSWKLEILPLLDLISPGYSLGLSIGRIGCFLGGCCYGKHTGSSCSVYFTDSIAPAANSIQPLIPVQLYSAFLLFLLSVLLTYLFLRNDNSGKIFGLFLLMYSTGRFLLEFFRDDSRHFVLGLSDGQLYSIILFITGTIIMLRKKILFNLKLKSH